MYNLKYVSTKNRAQTKIDVKNNFLSDSKLKVNELPNAVVASREMGGPGVFSNDEQYVKISDFTKSTDEIRKLKKSTIQFVNEEVVFIGTFYHGYGHILTDDLKHLWILLSENRLNKLKFVFVQYSNDSINEIFFEICEILGKPRNEIVQIKGARRFSKVYIPDQCFFVKPGGNLDQSGYRYYTKEYKAIIERIKIAAPDTADVDKIYFTRTAFKRPRFREFGERFLEKTFSDLGYTIISPEKIGFMEQVALLKKCKAFAATQGSISLNAVFCHRDARVILINKQDFNDPYQLAINHLRGGDSVIIDANKSVLNERRRPWVGPFFMYNSRELCEFAGIEYKGIPKLEFGKYLFVGNLRRAKNRFYQFRG